MREIQEMQDYLDELDEPIVYGEGNDLNNPSTPEHRRYAPIAESKPEMNIRRISLEEKLRNEAEKMNVDEVEERGRQALSRARNLLSTLSDLNDDQEKSYEPNQNYEIQQSNNVITLGDATRKIFSMYDQINETFSHLKDRTVIFERSSSILHQNSTDEDSLPDYPLHGWKECARQITKIRLTRLQEINDILESEVTINSKNTELNALISKIHHIRRRIENEHKKNELAARKYRANPPPNQKPVHYVSDNYQVGIYRTQMAKCICKLFLIFMRMEVRRNQIRNSLIVKMQDEIYGNLT